MTRTLACLATLAAALQAAPALAAPETRTGTFQISATIYLSGNVPATASLSGSFNIIAADYSSIPSVSQNMSCKTTITRSGNVGRAAVSCPYRYTFDSASYARLRTSISFSVQGAQSSAQQSQIRLAPANGATTPIAFYLNL